jgi:hypothetical protein
MKKDAGWPVLFHLEFHKWFAEQEEGLQDEIWVFIGLLERFGPNLARPHADSVKGSTFSNMKELRLQYQGKPWRILFAFDPKRNAVLLVGGTKVGKENWYDVHIPIADERFQRYLVSLKKPRKE